SYAKRYNVLCERLVQESLYSAASVLLSPRSSVADGSFSEMSELTSLKTFAAGLAGHVAAEATRWNSSN
ncbi:PaeR7I family type II restriction endonuclease, partial [Candidatus Synechococcus spongiarum]